MEEQLLEQAMEEELVPPEACFQPPPPRTELPPLGGVRPAGTTARLEDASGALSSQDTNDPGYVSLAPILRKPGHFPPSAHA